MLNHQYIVSVYDVIYIKYIFMKLVYNKHKRNKCLFNVNPDTAQYLNSVSPRQINLSISYQKTLRI